MRTGWLGGLIAVAMTHAVAAAEPCREPGVITDDAEPKTVTALSAALDDRGVRDRGTTWIGKLRSVGGGERDTIIFVPAALDRSQPVDLIVFMDGINSFAKRTMDRRHSAAIAAIAERGANAVYVAPDAPTSAFGDRTALTGVYWRAGCARRRCRKDGTRAGDFVAMVGDVTAKVDELTCGGAAAIGWHLDLIGFSGGGRGVREAVEQLTHAPKDPRLAGVALHRIVFADATYSTSWAASVWKRVRNVASLVEVTLLVQAGDYDPDETEPGHGSRWRAWKQVHAEARRARTPVNRDGDDVVAGKLRLRRVALCHHRLGDAAHDAVLPLPPDAPPVRTAWSTRDRSGTHRCLRGAHHARRGDERDP